MTESRPRGTWIEQLVIPLAAAVITLVASTLLGWQRPEFFFAGVGLAAVLFVSIGAAQFAIGKASRRRERDDLYHVITSLALATPERSKSAGVISESEVLAIESLSDEVWVYAYDLAWEDEESAFNQLVRSNLERGVTYRYLIPDDPAVIQRAQQMRSRLLAKPKPKGKLEIASTSRERVITQFGLTVYNPAWSLVKGVPPGRIENTTAVYFPHYIDLQLSGATDIPFLSIKGAGTRRVQEAFVSYWNAATTLPA